MLGHIRHFEKQVIRGFSLFIQRAAAVSSATEKEVKWIKGAHWRHFHRFTGAGRSRRFALAVASNNVGAELRRSADKRGVVVPALVVPDLHQLEAVDVELTLEGLELGLHKVRLHDCSFVHFWLVDLEGIAACLPGDDILKTKGFGVFEEGVNLAWKGQGVEDVIVLGGWGDGFSCDGDV